MYIWVFGKVLVRIHVPSPASVFNIITCLYSKRDPYIFIHISYGF